MYTCMQKINFIIYFFHQILHFKESCNLIGQQHFGLKLENQDFARYGIGSKISITTLVFIFDYFQEKLTTNFSKNQKKLFRGHFGPFFSKFEQKRIFLKKELCQFLNIPITYHRAKNQKKLTTHS